MYSLSARALEVCLIAASLTGPPASGAEGAGDWKTVHHAGREAYRRGDYAEAAGLLANSWTLAQTPDQMAISANDTAAAFHNMRRDREAVPWFKSAMSIWQMLPDHSDDLVETAVGLADADSGLGDLTGAERTLRQALTAPRISIEHRAELQNSLGDLLRSEDRLEAARPLFAASVQLAGISRLRQIESLMGMADVDRRIRNWSLSVDEWNRAAGLAQAEGSASFEALAQRGLGLTWLDSGDPARAEPLLRRSLAVFEASPDQAREVAAGSSSLASVYRRQNRLSLAEQAWLHALEIDRRELGEEHPQTAVIMECLSELYSAQRRFDEARAYAAHALAIMRRLDPESPPVAGALSIMGLAKQREMQPQAAAADYAQALAILRSNNAMGDQIATEIADRYATVLATLHKSREAKQIRAEIRSFHER